VSRRIRLAAALLPRATRDRYREQWLADYRDAEAEGLSPSGIAWGALAFALTAPRPGPAIAVDPVRMRRLAFAVSLAAALIGLTYYPSWGYGLGLLAPLAAVWFVLDAVVLAVQALGTLAAISLIAGRGASRAERWSAAMLALAATSPLAADAISRVAWNDGDYFVDLYVYPATAAYLAAVVLIVGAIAVRRPRVTRPRPRPRTIALGAAAIAALGAALWALAASIWFTRAPLVAPELGSTLYGEWLELKTAYEAHVTAVLVGSAGVAVALVVAVVVIGIAHRAVDLRIAVVIAAFALTWGWILLAQYLALGVDYSALADAANGVRTLLRLAIVVAVLAVEGGRRPFALRPHTASGRATARAAGR